MIKYCLQCEKTHEFEGWFRSSSDFDIQAEKKMLTCPVCGSDDVKKAIMAPSVSTSRRKAGVANEARLREMQSTLASASNKVMKHIEKNFDYVGQDFPEEARKIHYGETETRGIFGEASGKEAKELIDEGVNITPLPTLDASKQKKKLS